MVAGLMRADNNGGYGQNNNNNSEPFLSLSCLYVTLLMITKDMLSLENWASIWNSHMRPYRTLVLMAYFWCLQTTTMASRMEN